MRLEATKCAISFIEDYDGPERELLPFHLFHALVELTKEQLEAGVPPDEVKFDAKELTARTVVIGYTKQPKKNAETKWVSSNWKRLTEFLSETHEEIQRIARANNFTCLPKLAKDESKGGRAQRSYYRLESTHLPDKEMTKDYPIPGGGLRYRPEIRRKIPWIGRLYIGKKLGRLRLFMIFGLFMLIVLLALFPAIQPLFTGQAIPIETILKNLFIFGILLYYLLGPFFSVLYWKVAPIPFWRSHNNEVEPVILEAKETIQDSQLKIDRIDQVRYVSSCPICDGRVLVGGGGFRFLGRLVGRCERSPREHIFSFDHVTRTGSPLNKLP